MELVVGTYDEVLLGFRLVEVGETLQLEASFTDRSHTGCIKAVAISRKGVLASGGTDETIRLLSLRKHRELGSLVNHTGTVTSLEFHKNFLFSTSEDGKLCLWKCFTWECLRTFKGHKAAADCVAVHPSGKLALTVGRDKSLHTWNLITGRSAYITNIKQVADYVRWSPDGTAYLVVVNNKVDLYLVETGDVKTSIQAEKRINAIEFLTDEVCIYGGEGGTVIIQNLETGEILHTLDTGTNRIKGLCLSCSTVTGEEGQQCLTVASSDGYIKLYSFKENKGKYSTELKLQYSTGFRLTCLAVYTPTVAPSDTAENQSTEVTECTGSDVDNSEHSNATKQSQKKVKAKHKNTEENGNRKRKLETVTIEQEKTGSQKISKRQKIKKQKKTAVPDTSQGRSVEQTKKNMKKKNKTGKVRKVPTT